MIIENAVTCRLKYKIVEPEETSFARQRLGKYVPAETLLGKQPLAE
jgi:hypothetical protein